MTERNSEGGLLQRSDGEIAVLHVDDDPSFLELSVDLLKREDESLIVDTETNPHTALDLIERGKYDCIVSDYEMPTQDGIEFLKAVREVRPDLPFILFTGKGSETVASEAISAGVSDYLQKQSGTEQFELLANRIASHVERTRALRTLREREAHLRQAQTVANIGSWYKDIDADEIYWSNEVYEIFEVDESERPLDHERFLEYVHPEDSEDVDRAWNAALDGEAYDIEHRIVTDTDKTKWVRERAMLDFEDGEPSEALGVVQDITDRKRREKRLEQTTARLEALFENSPDMIDVHDSDGNILDANPRLCEKTGYDEAELTDMKVWELDQTITPERARAVWEEMEVGDRYRVEGEYLCEDGSTFPVEIHLRRMNLDGRDQFVVISREIPDSAG